ncbi:MAG: hypothetical protein H6667_08135 [Ardenticatenaceae bacterium]|nr:hypothetical protein [Ardenticatenaceae bacterium]MCB9444689.1 hypothetical protein [Ardenticatenaceae bacterium]
MRTYRSKQYGFEIDIPPKWSFPRGEPVKGQHGASIGFIYSDTKESFNIVFGWIIPEPLEQTEREFKRYAQEKQYTDLEFGRITVGHVDHVTARYRMTKRDWMKKYLIVFGETEYAMTVGCSDQQVFEEREQVWDGIAGSFRLITPTKPVTTSSKIDRMMEAAKFAKRGHAHFRAGRYQKALKEFRMGMPVTHEFPWNFFGASMTLMQMVEKGHVPEDQILATILEAENFLKICLLIDPRHWVS